MPIEIPHKNDAKVDTPQNSRLVEGARNATTVDKAKGVTEYTTVRELHAESLKTKNPTDIYEISDQQQVGDNVKSSSSVLMNTELGEVYLTETKGNMFTPDNSKLNPNYRKTEYSAAIPKGMADALQNAMDRAFKDGKLSAKESEQFDNVRALIGSSIKDDSKIDAGENKAIISALNNISSSKGQGR